ncbi:hypothetical protein M231_03697 [Tremella mesenterica]|uniref:SNARE-complex protein Syntaxin-18 N-terminal domain-containing protein n=1 Tax=Tremella mesenterica TaxID=5217 RepID=A0A4V1M433_TREME|nr:hypothetical protein M231_03697 [Tremella mesenterica]
MVYIDRTSEFQQLIGVTNRPKSPARRVRSLSRPRLERQKEEHDAFLKEAYRIHNHLTSLSTLLHSIRKPYLATSEPPRRPPRHQSSLVDTDNDDVMKKWEGSKYLSDRERDEIDTTGRMILRRCKEWVQLLEDSEKTRKTKSSSHSTLLHLLPSLAQPLNPLEPLITAHRASILWTLDNLLTRTTSSLSSLQEERSRRRLEREKTLGSGASREAARLQVLSETKPSFFSLHTPKQKEDTSTLSDFPGGFSNLSTRQVRISNSTSNTQSQGVTVSQSSGEIHESGDQEKNGDEDLQLSPALIQQLENENNTLLSHMESTLSSVLSAEKSLLEISTLQTELVRHLVQQTEITDRLYDEAVGSVGQMGSANEQLKKARKRGGEARFFLLVFLLGASGALLFLHWYS